ncbi:unnamed protein product [Phytophthora lilii]|uniref:Unnamed protein product n=1 Tax=Phytophthora lilii TaxID=2077276 RepID=A0A9W6X9L4_9STRA|nr:unnamed protein product [Phytophthora lilii]
MSLDDFKTQENSWLEQKLPGFVGRGLASSPVLVLKLEKILADHVRMSWVPQSITRIWTDRYLVYKRLEQLGPTAETVVNHFLPSSPPTSGHLQMRNMLEAFLPGLLGCIENKILRLTTMREVDESQVGHI